MIYLFYAQTMNWLSSRHVQEICTNYMCCVFCRCLCLSILSIYPAGLFPWIWWRHQMQTFSALLAMCTRNSLVTGEFSAQRPVTRGFDVFFDLRLNKRLSKQLWGWWFETLSHQLWRYGSESKQSYDGPMTVKQPWRIWINGQDSSICCTSFSVVILLMHHLSSTGIVTSVYTKP